MNKEELIEKIKELVSEENIERLENEREESSHACHSIIGSIQGLIERYESGY